MTPLPDGKSSLELWFNRGKEDAWANRSKQPPEQDPEAASFYDLGYSEGAIGHSAAMVIKPDQSLNDKKIGKKVPPEFLGASQLRSDEAN